MCHIKGLPAVDLPREVKRLSQRLVPVAAPCLDTGGGSHAVVTVRVGDLGEHALPDHGHEAVVEQLPTRSSGVVKVGQGQELEEAYNVELRVLRQFRHERIGSKELVDCQTWRTHVRSCELMRYR